MIVFLVGTTAELIKIAPVFHEVRDRGAAPVIWFTGQHVADVPEMLERLSLPEPARWMTRGIGGRDVERPFDVPRWLGKVLRFYRLNRAAMRAELSADCKQSLVLVHGDTFTTVVGAFIGRRLGARVGHIEAGMRSGSLRSPFPEEANRRLVARLADLHFAPSDREVANLTGVRGRVVSTGANTVVDSVRLVGERLHTAPSDLPEHFGVATLHRFELVRDQGSFATILKVLQRASRETPILMYTGASERARIERYGLGDLFDDRFVLKSKLPYVEFLPVLGAAAFVVTDSGGLQQECAYLGIPCLVHRERTESHQGIGENVVLSGLDLGVVDAFLADASRYRIERDLDAYHPSKVIVDCLARLGHL